MGSFVSHVYISLLSKRLQFPWYCDENKHRKNDKNSLSVFIVFSVSVPLCVCVYVSVSVFVFVYVFVFVFVCARTSI